MHTVALIFPSRPSLQSSLYCFSPLALDRLFDWSLFLSFYSTVIIYDTCPFHRRLIISKIRLCSRDPYTKTCNHFLCLKRKRSTLNQFVRFTSCHAIKLPLVFMVEKYERPKSRSSFSHELWFIIEHRSYEQLSFLEVICER